VARRCFRISLKWRVLACEDFSRHKPKKALKAGKVTGPHSPPLMILKGLVYVGKCVRGAGVSNAVSLILNSRNRIVEI